MARQNEIKVYALGGLGEVGKNCYGIEYNDQIFLIDCGILFPDALLPGVDYVIPDFSYLIKNQKKIVGLFITHGHEDHIGGIPYLARQIKLNAIYTSGIAIDLIKAKFLEHPNVELPKIVPFDENSRFDFGHINFSFIRINHSIPDSYSIVIDTPYGKIIHTGDFKVDFTPHAKLAEYDKLAAYGKEGVLLLLSDSTNAMQEGFSTSEQKVEESINDLFSTIDGRIIIATFASNMFRIDQIIQASIQTKRKIAICGKSMEKTIEIGLKNGAIKAKPSNFIAQEAINEYNSDKLTILCTGSQGEPMAALTRIANGSHKYITLRKNDTIIFSSSPIPGNAEGVNRTINSLFKRDVNVVINSPLNDIHASGHANQGELRMIHSFVNEKYFMPIHGEYRMLKMNAKIAQDCGVKKENCFIMENGNILHINDKKAYIKGNVQSGETYIDGSQVGEFSSNIVWERKQLSNDGMFTFIFLINNNQLVGKVQVVSRGFIYMKENEDFTKELIEVASNIVKKDLANNVKVSDIKKDVEINMEKYIDQKIGRTPMIITSFIEVGENLWKSF